MENRGKDREKKYQFIMNLLDKTTFFRIFFLWIGITFLFGLIYTVSSYTHAGSLVNKDGNKITGFFDHIYYSFITATSTGYGDITPSGTFMRLLAIFNVITGMLMMSIVTSKLVTMKQDKMLEHIYSLSFSDKLGKTINGLALFKNEAEKTLAALDHNHVISRKDLHNLKLSIVNLRSNMIELKREFSKNNLFSKIEGQQIEQILNGMEDTYESLLSLTENFKKNELSFKNPTILEEMYYIGNIGTLVTNKIKQDFPIYTQKTKAIQNLMHTLNTNLMNFKIVSNDEIELEVPQIMISQG